MLFCGWWHLNILNALFFSLRQLISCICNLIISLNCWIMVHIKFLLFIILLVDLLWLISWSRSYLWGLLLDRWTHFRLRYAKIFKVIIILIRVQALSLATIFLLRLMLLIGVLISISLKMFMVMVVNHLLSIHLVLAIIHIILRWHRHHIIIGTFFWG